MSKKLVAFFSASGVTAAAAKALAEAAQADLFEIIPEQPYTQADLNWRNPLSRCNRERIKSEKPSIVRNELDESAYDTVFLGFPVWYYREPLIVDSFLDAYDFSGKCVVLFATSGGSAFGKTVEKMSALYPEIEFVEGMMMNSNPSAEELNDFARQY